MTRHDFRQISQSFRLPGNHLCLSLVGCADYVIDDTHEMISDF